jgi:anti-sigma factor RsiW
MANIIRLHGAPHEAIQKLLPWYANGTLDADETTAVEAHLDGCAECRAEFESDRALGMMIATVPSDVERGWAAMKGRIDGEPSSRTASNWRVPAAFLSRRVPMSWALGAQAACLTVVVGLAWFTASQPRADYHALSSPKAAAPGNVVVVFSPTTSEADLRGLLRLSQARLVDGPTVSDAYVLHVSINERPAALARLRADSHVVLAEPIDGDAHP